MGVRMYMPGVMLHERMPCASPSMAKPRNPPLSSYAANTASASSGPPAISFSSGETAGPSLVTTSGSATGLDGDEYDLVIEWSEVLDEGDGAFDLDAVTMYEADGDDAGDPTDVTTEDVTDEEVTLTYVSASPSSHTQANGVGT